MKSLADMFRGKHIDKECPHCNIEFRSDGSDGKEAQKAMDGLAKSIKNLNRRNR